MPKNGSTTWNRNAKIRSALRQVWLRSPLRYEAVKAARVERGRYKCSVCNELFSAKEIQIDHIEPAGSLIGSVDAFVERLFCPSEKLRAVCRPCHKSITNINRTK